MVEIQYAASPLVGLGIALSIDFDQPPTIEIAWLRVVN
jgi:hypothetical protein